MRLNHPLRSPAPDSGAAFSGDRRRPLGRREAAVAMECTVRKNARVRNLCLTRSAHTRGLKFEREDFSDIAGGGKPWTGRGVSLPWSDRQDGSG
jgi:hypothetical protein